MEQTYKKTLSGGLNTQGIYKQGRNGFPLVTLITSVWNGVDSIETAIESILSQGYPNIEYIIIDGGSTDGTLDIIKKYSDKVDYWISEKDTGIYNAWNKGLGISKGEWIGFIGADDVCMPNAIQKMVESILRSEHDLEYLSGRSNIVCDGKLIRVTGEKWQWKKFKHYVCTAQAGALHSRKLYNTVGFYDENFKIVGDYELLLRRGEYLKTAFIPDITVSFAIGGISNNNYKVIEETYRAKSMHSGINKFILLLSFLKLNIAFFLKKILKKY